LSSFNLFKILKEKKIPVTFLLLTVSLSVDKQQIGQNG